MRCARRLLPPTCRQACRAARAFALRLVSRCSAGSGSDSCRWSRMFDAPFGSEESRLDAASGRGRHVRAGCRCRGVPAACPSLAYSAGWGEVERGVLFDSGVRAWSGFGWGSGVSEPAASASAASRDVPCRSSPARPLQPVARPTPRRAFALAARARLKRGARFGFSPHLPTKGGPHPSPPSPSANGVRTPSLGAACPHPHRQHPSRPSRSPSAPPASSSFAAPRVSTPITQRDPTHPTKPPVTRVHYCPLSVGANTSQRALC